MTYVWHVGVREGRTGCGSPGDVARRRTGFPGVGGGGGEPGRRPRTSLAGACLVAQREEERGGGHAGRKWTGSRWASPRRTRGRRKRKEVVATHGHLTSILL